MSARDIYGHTFVDEDGNIHTYDRHKGIQDEHWVFSYYFDEPDHPYASYVGNHSVVSINPRYSFEFVKKIFEQTRAKISKEVPSRLEEMIGLQVRDR